MPQVEAASCGVPIASVDYSAMADVVRKTKGIPLKVDRMFYEWETNAYRAYPDNNYAADQFYKFLSQNESYKKIKSQEASQASLEYFSYDKTAKIWEKHFESIVLTGNQGKWNAQSRLNNTNITPYIEEQCNKMTNAGFIEWLCVNVAKTPELFHSYYAMNLIEQLNYGITSCFKDGRKISKKDVYEIFKVIGINKITCEQARLNKDSLNSVDFIEFAHLFEKEKIG